jgi:selenocysteine-specific elongation factor
MMKMNHFVIGTAGHIDHGKTNLVKALTGIDTDRLAEEKKRGISINLGFAHLHLTPDRVVSFIDVPGHERFVRNMLAGAAGVDAVLLVVAGDDGIKPQTREHFEICRLLGIAQGIVVITKSDLPEKPNLETEIAELVSGSFLENCPILRVSAATGAGLSDLRDLLIKLSITAEKEESPLRLPVDRAFIIKGFGTVVTGTLSGGRLNVGDTLQNGISAETFRVRSLQVHGNKAETAIAGQRVAVNFADAKPEQVMRGSMLIQPGSLQPHSELLIEIELLPSARALSDVDEILIYSGTAEVSGSLRVLSGEIQPGKLGFARLLLKEKLVTVPEDRLILRLPAPVRTIAGGRVLELSPTKQNREKLRLRAESLSKMSVADRVSFQVDQADTGISLMELATKFGLTKFQMATLAKSRPWISAGDWILEEAKATQIQEQWRKRLTDFHAQHPLRLGMPREELRGKLPPETFARLLISPLVLEQDLVRLASHRVQLQSPETDAQAKMEKSFETAGLSVPSADEVLQKSGVSAAKAKELLQMLLKSRRVVKIGEGLILHHSALATLKLSMQARKGKRFGVGEFKEWTGVSRKYAIPLLEWLDRERVTRRVGESREVI